MPPRPLVLGLSSELSSPQAAEADKAKALINTKPR
jgi:hypothetical protein